MTNDLGVYCLDVGQGDCTFIIPPRGGAILFDVRDEQIATHFVLEHNLELRTVVASHLDKDHVGGMLGFLRSYFERGQSLDRLYIDIDRPLSSNGDKYLRSLVQQALAWDANPPSSSPGLAIKSPFRDNDGPVMVAEGDDWTIEIVLPFRRTVTSGMIEGKRKSNRCSAALRVSRADAEVLIGGDATLGSWENLEERLRPAKVFRVPHHGGEIRDDAQQWRDFSDLYDSVGADVGIISVGTNNRAYENAGRHPHPQHVAAIRRGGVCRVLCTQLTDRCHTDPQALRDRALKLASGVSYAYRHGPRGREVPCAGSVMLSINAAGDITVEPSSASHEQLLERLDKPMCKTAANQSNHGI